uniref:macrophage mannose receptor 1-like isoform X2 n=1 Tax=Ciona intestinalis TaxID=7719 RepID=UPI00089DC798|nr:macrophage mannose receptor 1-like isoform X2 [Ciona intestinalis]|eukprot:XP_009859990.2 macrophage mannose receptor 1-like isoform X2 [Ciona intestinalis]
MKNWLLFVVSFCLVVICKGQVTWQQLGSNEYYIYTGVGVNYSAAVSACHSMGATLARIKTKQVQDFVMEKITLSPSVTLMDFYIGLKRFNSSSTGFQWNDGTMVTSGYTKWAIDEPNNMGGNENCVQLYYSWNGVWNDVPCSWNRRYICERRLDTQTTDKTTTDTQMAFTTTTNNDPLEQMKTCEFSIIHVVMSLLGSIVGTSVVFIIGIWIYCKKRRNNYVTVPPPPKQELHLEPTRQYYDITNERNQAQHDVTTPPPPQQGEYLEPIRHDSNDGYVTFESNR